MATTLASLIAELKVWAQPDPNVDVWDDTTYAIIVGRAVTNHNPAYRANTSSCNVPDREAWVVVVYSWALLQLMRANRLLREIRSNAQSFSADKSTQYDKAVKFYKELLARYDADCRSLQLSSYAGAGAVRSTAVLGENLDIDALTPLELAPQPPAVTLSADALQTDGSLVLYFPAERADQYVLKRWVLHLIGNEAIIQPWNRTTVGELKGVSSNAEQLVVFTDPQVACAKVLNLEQTPGTVHRFVIVTVTTSGIYGYSNELVVLAS